MNLSEPAANKPSAPGHMQAHIDLIVRHEQEFLEKRTQSEKLGDKAASYIGSLTFVGLHIVACPLWIAWNSLPIAMLPHFDPFPYPLLDVVLAFEAILVASLILMRQSRMARRAEERDQLMLQILLLTEREITAVLGVDRQVAESMGLEDVAADEEVTQLSQQTPIDEVAQILREKLPTE